MKRFLLFALVATMFAACVTDETQDVAVELAPETLTVSFEGDDSRIQLQNGKTVWTQGDLVSVFYLSNANQKWQYQGKTGERTGDLKRVMNVEATQELSSVVVVYPYNENYYINPRTCNVRATLPATQHYLKDSYGLDGNILISASEYNQFSLKNVCGWLKIQLKGEGQVVKTITLKGNNGEQVAGQIYINSADATATLASEMGVADDEENGTGGNLVFDDTILKEVTLDCGEGVTLGAEPTVFYIALPPQTFEKGLIIDVESVDGGKMTKSTSNAITIARNTIQPMTVFEFVYSNTPASTVPANNEIWYTSLDDNIVTPNATDVFGVNIVSNTYEDGKGVITFDGEVTMIGEKAFFECSTLASISIPTTITKMYADAFRTCSSLKRVDIFDLSAWCKIRFVNNAGASPLCEGADLYLNGELLTDLVIPSDITKLYFAAFFGCTSLKSVTIPSHVTSVHKSAFNRCTSLTNATIDNGVTSIGEYAFYNCTSLTSVTIGNRVTEIGGYAFKGCTSLTSVTIPDSVTEIGDYAFENCSSLTDITIGNGVTSIGVLAFDGCMSLRGVHISDLSAWCKISYPGGGASPLYYAGDLYLNGELVTELTIPSDITEIKKHAFRGCNSLKSVTIPDSVISIGGYAFYDCNSLTSVTIPNSVAEIGDKAFKNCTSLTSVHISDLSAWCKIDFRGSSASPLFHSSKLYINGTEATDITIPSDITEIKQYAFYGCSALTITIPNGVTSIGIAAFFNCNLLTSITIPDSVIEIGNYAFASCRKLKYFYGKFASSDNRCVIVGNSLNSYAGGTNITSYEIPGNITTIDSYAFQDNDYLKSVTIHDGVTSIGSQAFFHCSALKEVYCKSTTPPTGGNLMFSYAKNYTDYYPLGCNIYVPRNSVEAYKAASRWSDYASYIVGYNF